MLMLTVAAVTIGQAPRPDVVPEMAAFLPRVRWIEAGALDDVGEADIRLLAPGSGDFPLVTRLASGRTVVLGEHALVPRLQAAVARVEREADLVIVLCSGIFPLRCRVPIVYPGAVLEKVAGKLYRGARILVLTPDEGQVAAQQVRWRDRGVEATVRCASPYADTDFAVFGREARALGVAVVVLDCMGYTLSMKEAVADLSGVPTLLVRSLTARVAAEMLMAVSPGGAASATGWEPRL